MVKKWMKICKHWAWKSCMFWWRDLRVEDTANFYRAIHFKLYALQLDSVLVAKRFTNPKVWAILYF